MSHRIQLDDVQENLKFLENYEFNEVLDFFGKCPAFFPVVIVTLEKHTVYDFISLHMFLLFWS